MRPAGLTHPGKLTATTYFGPEELNIVARFLREQNEAIASGACDDLIPSKPGRPALWTAQDALNAVFRDGIEAVKKRQLRDDVTDRTIAQLEAVERQAGAS